MMNEREAQLAQQLLQISTELAASRSVMAQRAGERTAAIIGDVLYEHDPLTATPAVGKAEAPGTPPYDKPLPIVNEENRGHWDAAHKGELRLQRCLDCSFIRYPIASVCPRCLSTRLEWAHLSGRGMVASWVVFHKAYWPGFKPDLPFIVAQIELEEGPRYTSNLVGIATADVHIGMAVKVEFEAVTETIALPKFRPA